MIDSSQRKIRTPLERAEMAARVTGKVLIGTWVDSSSHAPRKMWAHHLEKACEGQVVGTAASAVQPSAARRRERSLQPSCKAPRSRLNPCLLQIANLDARPGTPMLSSLPVQT